MSPVGIGYNNLEQYVPHLNGFPAQDCQYDMDTVKAAAKRSLDSMSPAAQRFFLFLCGGPKIGVGSTRLSFDEYVISRSLTAQTHNEHHDFIQFVNPLNTESAYMYSVSKEDYVFQTADYKHIADAINAISSEMGEQYGKQILNNISGVFCSCADYYGTYLGQAGFPNGQGESDVDMQKGAQRRLMDIISDSDRLGHQRLRLSRTMNSILLFADAQDDPLEKARLLAIGAKMANTAIDACDFYIEKQALHAASITSTKGFYLNIRDGIHQEIEEVQQTASLVDDDDALSSITQILKDTGSSFNVDWAKEILQSKQTYTGQFKRIIGRPDTAPEQKVDRNEDAATKEGLPSAETSKSAGHSKAPEQEVNEHSDAESSEEGLLHNIMHGIETVLRGIKTAFVYVLMFLAYALIDYWPKEQEKGEQQDKESNAPNPAHKRGTMPQKAEDIGLEDENNELSRAEDVIANMEKARNAWANTITAEQSIESRQPNANAMPATHSPDASQPPRPINHWPAAVTIPIGGRAEPTTERAETAQQPIPPRKTMVVSSTRLAEIAATKSETQSRA